MARRAQSAPQTSWLVAGLACLLLLVAAGGYFFGRGGNPYRSVPQLPVDEYLTSPGSLRGNTYRLSAAVLNSIASSPGGDRLISVQPESATAPLPLVLPASLGLATVQKGQRFHFLVEIGGSGILRVSELTKS